VKFLKLVFCAALSLPGMLLGIPENVPQGPATMEYVPKPAAALPARGYLEYAIQVTAYKDNLFVELETAEKVYNPDTPTGYRGITLPMEARSTGLWIL
jgi:hypothetical protein